MREDVYYWTEVLIGLNGIKGFNDLSLLGEVEPALFTKWYMEMGKKEFNLNYNEDELLLQVSSLEAEQRAPIIISYFDYAGLFPDIAEILNIWRERIKLANKKSV